MRVKKVVLTTIIAVAYAITAALVIRSTVVYWDNPWWAWAGGAASLVLLSLAWIAYDRAWATLRWRGYARPMLDAPVAQAFGARVRNLANSVSSLWEGQDETNRLHPVERLRDDCWRVPFDDGSVEDVHKTDFYYWLLACWKRQERGLNGLAQRYWEPKIGRRQLDARRALLLRASALANYAPRKVARLKVQPWLTWEAVEAVMTGTPAGVAPAPAGDGRDDEDLSGRYEVIDR